MKNTPVLIGEPGVGKTAIVEGLAARIAEGRVPAAFKAQRIFALDLALLVAGAVARGQFEERRFAVMREAEDSDRKLVLFVDEVHRFNKSQQDAFLPYIEDGTVIFIGATTENPSFELNNALLSRARVYVLKPLDSTDLIKLQQQALSDPERGIGEAAPAVEEGVLERIAGLADGDARRALNLLEIAVELVRADGLSAVSLKLVEQAAGTESRRFDKGGDVFYDQISALHKAVRGSSPDGALYWFARMLDGGCDPLYIVRRVVRMASEDIGNADPRALEIALSAWDVQTRLGSPEGELAIAQAVVYMACAPKSNAVYTAFKAVKAFIAENGSHEVPLHLRNAPTKLMKSQGYGAEYRYAHDFPDAFAAGENYLPEPIYDQHWYDPVPRGLEIKIAEKLKFLREQDRKSPWKRYDGKGGKRE